MFAEMFVVGTFWFWALLLAEFIFLIVLLEHERYVAAPLTVLGVVVAVVLFGSGMGDLVRWIVHNPIATIFYTVGYFLVGALFVSLPFGKWWWFVRDVRDKNRDVKQTWLEDWQNNANVAAFQVANLEKAINDNKAIPQSAERVAEWEEQLPKAKDKANALKNCNGNMTQELLPFWKQVEANLTYTDWLGRTFSIEKPVLRKFKLMIISWVVYWPPVMFWTLLNDPLRRIGRRIYDAVAIFLQRITDLAWKDEDKIVG